MKNLDILCDSLYSTNNYFMKFLSLLVSVFLFTAFAHQPSAAIPVNITITDIKPDKNGVVIISIYKVAENFPYKPYETVKVDKSTMVGGILTYDFKVSAAGKYAISLLDDLNENDDMDYNFFGIPKEGYGFSNDAGPRGFSPPNFEDAAFEVGENGTNITTKMKYFL